MGTSARWRGLTEYDWQTRVSGRHVELCNCASGRRNCRVRSRLASAEAHRPASGRSRIADDKDGDLPVFLTNVARLHSGRRSRSKRPCATSVAHRQSFICRRVRLRAAVESDCFENSVLMGDGCGRGLVPFGGADSGVDALFDSVCSLSSRRPAEVKEAATFTGMLRPFVPGLNDAMVLEIEKVEDIRPEKGPKDKHKTGAR